MQIAKRLDARLPGRFQDMMLDPSWAMGGPIDPNSAYNWLNTVFGGMGQPAAENAARSLRNFIPVGEGRNVNEWRAELMQNLSDPQNQQYIAGMLQQAAYDTTYRFANFFSDKVLSTVEGELAAVGLPYVREMLDRVKDVLASGDRLQPQLNEFSNSFQNFAVLALPQGAEPVLSPLTGKGQMTDPTPTVNALLGLYHQQFYHYFLLATAHILQDVLQDYVDENLFHLQRELGDAHEVLEKAAQSRPETNKLADVRTNEVNAWPEEIDEVVESRFKGAENEIMLTDVNAFITDYQDQMLRTIQDQHATSHVQHYDQAYPFAVRAVIRGEWDSLDANKAPNNTLAPQKRTNDEYSNRAGFGFPSTCPVTHRLARFVSRSAPSTVHVSARRTCWSAPVRGLTAATMSSTSSTPWICAAT